MSSPLRRRPARGASPVAATAWLVALASLAVGLAGPVLAQESEGPAQGSPAPSGAVLPGEPNPPWEDGAIPAQVVAGLENVRPRTWDHILVAPDGQTLTVYFSSGPQECHGLADVQVSEGDGEVGIELWVGDVPNAPVCAQVVQLYRVVVVLAGRAFTGGLLFDLPSG